ncbi:alpha-amylase family glycosyl hydrolase [Brachyspira hyodysenteriae]|uniref:alpha-amylase family glycosyl hydrolase n=1 Tax=Brachyspira hyodysenteriae TaxID=159 RepID=UPI000A14DE23|nr:alpha-amylase family glycosyl hydrolase [Brachyspira hyodysenteriae]MDA0080323.1 alpha-amylase family glycosyl hydrolase [Brachyspira hyodysenteriae]QTM08276.1 alpha-amylase [Brachyspira hyodysenteriae]
MKTSGYNLFPPLLGHIKNWYSHIDRIKNMGFEWVYINPITYPGFSGSLYATKYYYQYNPAFFTSCEQEIAEKEIKDFIAYCNNKNIKVMIDLVINHSSKDCNLTNEHLEWYKTKDGALQSPGAWDNGKWIEWGDLAMFNNKRDPNEKYEEENADNQNDQNSNKENNQNINNNEILNPIWYYWNDLIKHNIDLGFSGFRCDAAYKVPKELWKYLIDNAKQINNEVIFFAESLGCSMEDTKKLIDAGFDYVASSAKWWDYDGEWFIEQYDLAREKCKQIAFPSNHDTRRLIEEYDGNIWRVKQTFFFTAIVCDMWMITLGDEFGFFKRCNVVGGNEKDYENINYDLGEYIKDITNYIKNNPILAECGKIVSIDIEEKKKLDELKKEADTHNEYHQNNEYYEKEKIYKEKKEKDPFRKFYKYNLDGSDKLLIIVNITSKTQQLDTKEYGIKKDISFENKIENITETIDILPYQLKIFTL